MHTLRLACVVDCCSVEDCLTTERRHVNGHLFDNGTLSLPSPLIIYTSCSITACIYRETAYYRQVCSGCQFAPDSAAADRRALELYTCFSFTPTLIISFGNLSVQRSIIEIRSTFAYVHVPHHAFKAQNDKIFTLYNFSTNACTTCTSLFAVDAS